MGNVKKWIAVMRIDSFRVNGDPTYSRQVVKIKRAQKTISLKSFVPFTKNQLSRWFIEGK